MKKFFSINRPGLPLLIDYCEEQDLTAKYGIHASVMDETKESTRRAIGHVELTSAAILALTGVDTDVLKAQDDDTPIYASLHEDGSVVLTINRYPYTSQPSILAEIEQFVEQGLLYENPSSVPGIIKSWSKFSG